MKENMCLALANSVIWCSLRASANNITSKHSSLSSFSINESSSFHFTSMIDELLDAKAKIFDNMETGKKDGTIQCKERFF
jgi:hypothetical protein